MAGNRIVEDVMTSKKERGICELYAEDPERADALVFGRVAHGDRRGFLKGAGLAAMGAVVGGAIPFHRNMPGGLIPAALAETTKDFKLEGKDGLTVLNDRPINAETPAHLLDDDVTPNEAAVRPQQRHGPGDGRKDRRHRLDV